MQLNRRSFLGSALAATAALLTGSRAASSEAIEPVVATMQRLDMDQAPAQAVEVLPGLTHVGKTSDGLEYVCVPWGRGTNKSVVGFETRLLRPRGLPHSDSGYFVETKEGLREVLGDEDASKLLADLSRIICPGESRRVTLAYSEALRYQNHDDPHWREW